MGRSVLLEIHPWSGICAFGVKCCREQKKVWRRVCAQKKKPACKTRTSACATSWSTGAVRRSTTVQGRSTRRIRPTTSPAPSSTRWRESPTPSGRRSSWTETNNINGFVKSYKFDAPSFKTSHDYGCSTHSCPSDISPGSSNKERFPDGWTRDSPPFKAWIDADFASMHLETSSLIKAPVDESIIKNGPNFGPSIKDT